MSNSAVITAALRQRLQLAVGERAELGEEIPGTGGGRAFVAKLAEGGGAAVVTMLRGSSEGLDPEIMRRRITGIRALGHGLIDLPVAAGELDGHAWVVEAVSSMPSARDRLTAGVLPLAHGVSAIRDLCRALAAMHRRGIFHGAIGVDTVRISDTGARLGGVARADGGTARGDLDAVSDVAWALLSGELTTRSSRQLSEIRRGVPPALDALCVALHSPDVRRRPQRAEAVLELLDAVPGHRPSPLESIVDVSMHDGRPRRAVVWLVVGAALLLLLALLQSRT